MKKSQGIFLILIILIVSCQNKNVFDYKNKYYEIFNKNFNINDDLNNIINEKTKGLYPGTQEFNFAADYLSYKFNLLGLKDPKFLKNYFQYFSIKSRKIGKDPRIWIDKNYLELGKDYIISKTSGKSNIKNAKIVFVGFGLVLPEQNYNDYTAVNVENKIVIAFKNLPKRILIDNPEYSNIYYRAYLAKNFGAKGIIYIDCSNKNTDQIKNSAYIPSSYQLSNFPQIFIPHNKINLKRNGREINFPMIKDDILKSNEPYSFHLNNRVSMYLPMKIEREKTMNIIGYLPASEKYKQTKKNIIFATQLDGMGKQTEQIYHKNAVHNVSSIITLLNIAKNISNIQQYKRKNDIYFVIFSGTNHGLKGGQVLLSTEEFNKINTKYMINLSDIGASDIYFEIGGGLTYPSIYENIETTMKHFKIKLNLNISYAGYAEDQLFINRGIPSLYIYSSNYKLKKTLSDIKKNVHNKGIQKISTLLSLSFFEDIFDIEK